MPRVRQLIFAVSLLALCWYGMMAVHELGHVIGAYLTGGVVERVVLHPLTISRTDLSHNPHPGVVVWLGPLIGCALPVALAFAIPRRLLVARKIVMFFAGLCLIANGAYISLGFFQGIGDCGEMLRTGTPIWLMLLFGAITLPLGLLIWHELGSLRQFLDNPLSVTPMMAYSLAALLIVVVVMEFVIALA